MIAEIIAVGDEITSGQLLDTNSQWLSQRLEELGARILYHSTVGDELQPNIDLFRLAVQRADVVIITGGIGPTADDLTREALAKATNRELVLDQNVLQYIRDMFARRNWPMAPQNELQAWFPAGSRIVKNPHGTAPGIDLEVPRDGRSPARVICLPGVPAEMVDMWNDSVAASLAEFLGQGRVIRRRKIHCFGAGESRIESMLPDMIRRGRQPTVGITASRSTITLRIVAEGKNEQECLAAMEPTVQTIRERLGTLIYGEEDEELQHAVLKLLAERKKTLATAECGAAGLVAEWLASVDDPNNAYLGGVVVKKTAESAEKLAQQCRTQFNADFGLGIGPITDGTIALAVSSSDGLRQTVISCKIHPTLLHIYCAKHALNFLRLGL